MDQARAVREVVVTNIQMPFWSMVIFMVKWAIAAIPALVLLALIGVGIAALGAGIMSAVKNRPYTTGSSSAPYTISSPQQSVTGPVPSD